MDDFLNDIKEFIENPKEEKNQFLPNNLDNIKYTNQQTETYINQKEHWLVDNGFLPKLLIELTYKCNEKCIHCYNDKDNFNTDITFENIKPVIDDAIKCGVYKIILTGGECTLHPDFLKIASYIRERRIGLSILTNGINLYDNSELFKQIINLYPHAVKLSLYSMDNTIHDSITRIKGSHNKTLNVINKLKNNNIAVNVNFLQLENNNGSFKKVKDFCKSIDVNLISDINFLTNKDNSNKFTALSEENLHELLIDKEWPFSIVLNSHCNFNDKYYNSNVCKAARFIFVINPFLEVFPCVNFDYSLGNLKTKSFNEIFKGKKHKDFLKSFINKNRTECFKEDYCIYCTYCPAKVYKTKGMLKKAEDSCKAAKVINNIHKDLKKGEIYAK